MFRHVGSTKRSIAGVIKFTLWGEFINTNLWYFRVICSFFGVRSLQSKQSMYGSFAHMKTYEIKPIHVDKYQSYMDGMGNDPIYDPYIKKSRRSLRDFFRRHRSTEVKSQRREDHHLGSQGRDLIFMMIFVAIVMYRYIRLCYYRPPTKKNPSTYWSILFACRRILQ